MQHWSFGFSFRITQNFKASKQHLRYYLNLQHITGTLKYASKAKAMFMLSARIGPGEIDILKIKQSATVILNIIFLFLLSLNMNRSADNYWKSNCNIHIVFVFNVNSFKLPVKILSPSLSRFSILKLSLHEN